MNKTIAALLLLTGAGLAMGQSLRLPISYTDGMVIQRNKPIEIHGWSAPFDTIKIKIGEFAVQGIASQSGQWTASLPPMEATYGTTMTVTDGKTTLTYSDVVIGEVWIASGQSNMAFTLKQADTGTEDIATSADPYLRFFNMKPQYFCYGTPMPEWFIDSINHKKYYAPTHWEYSSPESSPSMTAVGYYFGKTLRDSLNVPVGIIHNAIGGCPVETWIDSVSLSKAFPEMLTNPRHNSLAMPWVQQRMTENVGENPDNLHPYQPGYLFETGIEPLGQFPIAGAIWYQGESNEHNPKLYERLFPWLVESWCQYWHDSSLPFIYTQLSSIAPRSTWPEFRDVQRRMLRTIPASGMAVCSDHGDSLDVHPRTKRPVGERLARWALHDVYGHKSTVPSGPLAKSAHLRGNEVIIDFDWGDGLTSSNGKEIGPFELAGADSVFHHTNAQIFDNNKIKLSNMQVPIPKYVRYGWEPFSHGNLINSDQLPASTFMLEIIDAEPGIEKGVSAMFYGRIGDKLIAAGGCNFPEDPLGPNSKKKFYQGIYACDLNLSNMTWAKIGELPYPMAYGASAVLKDGIAIIGGTTPNEAIRKAWVITLDQGKAVISPLPDLPFTLDNISAAVIGKKLYVAGGNCAGEPCNTLLCLDIENSEEGWVNLPSFPGNPRVQPVLASGLNQLGETCLYLWGGFAEKGPGREATLNTDGLIYSPSSKEWHSIAGPCDPNGKPISLGGGAACTLINEKGTNDIDGKILTTGGVNADVFLEALRNQAPDYLSHPIEWYRFNSYLLMFDSATQQWQILDQNPEYARAGAALIPGQQGDAYLLGGELKPRIRTPRLTHIKPI